MLRVEEFSELKAMPSLRAVWNELLSRTPRADFFRSYDWLETYLRHFGAGQRLRLLVVRDDTTPADAGPIGIVPLTVLTEPSKLGPLRILTYPAAYWGSHYGPIGPQPEKCLAAALAHVGRTRRDWDLLDLRFAPDAGDDPARTSATMARSGFRASPSLVDRTSFIDLPDSFDTYFAGRTKKWQANYRRMFRNLAKLGDLRCVRYRPQGETFADDGPRWDLYDTCEELARRSWQGSSTDGTTLTHAPIRPYLREMHATACRAGAADLTLLYLDAAPLAFLYGYHYRGSMFCLRTGFDARLAADGVGYVVYMQLIEDAIRRGDRLIDLGPGSLEAKRPLLMRTEPIYRHPYANPFSLRGLAWRAKNVLQSPGAATSIHQLHERR
ncbi:MAG: GNAT family N-acetyltransferase [Planctomycetia bacterium]|nr:GNAT family N-acetyltransferase [Planctomycetia bacterium]